MPTGRLAALGATLALHHGLLLAAAIPIVGLGQTASSEATARVVAIGDIHGAADNFAAILKAAGLTNDQNAWIGGRAHLVQTGDYLDRGERVRDVMDLLMRLEGEARKSGGQAQALLGNHEVMNLLHEFRDVSPQAFASFADGKSEDRRRRAHDEYLSVFKARGADAKPMAREEWMTSHPPGFLEYVEALAPRGRYGRWLRSRDVIGKEDGSVFMHAGLTPATTGSIDDVNRSVKREIEQWDRLRETLVRANLITSFFTFQETLAAIGAELNRIAAAINANEPPGDHVTREFVDQLQWAGGITKSPLLAADGPLWYRGLATLPDTSEAEITALLQRLGAQRFVTAHTPQLPGKITPRFQNRVFLIDTGMLTSYFKNGRPSAIELQGSAVTAIYLDGRETLVGTGPVGGQMR